MDFPWQRFMEDGLPVDFCTAFQLAFALSWEFAERLLELG